MSATSLIHPDDLDTTNDALMTARTGTLLNFENHSRHRDGSYRWFSWVAAPTPEGILAAGRHVTQEKDAAATLRRIENALRQPQKVEAVGQLTGGVAPDFNTLLTVIRASVDLLCRPGLSKSRRTRYIDAIADTADRAAKSCVARHANEKTRSARLPSPIFIGRRWHGTEQHRYANKAKLPA